MKKKLLVFVMLVGLASFATYATIDKKQEANISEDEYPFCGTPLDRNCNGIPDYMEEI